MKRGFAMKRSILAMLAVAGFGITAVAVPVIEKHVFHVVRITDFDKKEATQIMSDEEMKTLQKDIKVEAALYPKAVEAARLTWAKDETMKGKVFPKTSLSMRKMDLVGQPYPDEEKAQKKIDQLLDSQEKKEQRDMQRERQREYNSRPRGRGIAPVQPSKPTARSKDREKEKDDLVAKAAEMVRGEVDKLKEGLQKPGDAKGGDAAEPANAEPAKADGGDALPVAPKAGALKAGAARAVAK
jgi:hypothetical protein